MRIGEYLEVSEFEGKKVIRCSKCKYVYCSFSDNPKNYALMAELSLKKAGPLFPDTDRFVMKEFICPSCATIFAVEVAEKGAPILHDIELAPSRG